MKVKPVIVAWIKVDMMNDFAALGIRDLAMLPFAPTAFRAIPKAKCRSSVRFVGFFNRWACGGNGWRRVGNRANHLVSPALVCAVGKSLNFLVVSKERVSVTVPHLVVARAHLTGNDRPVTVKARASNNLTPPTVIRGAILLNALIMHQTKSVCSVLSSAPFNGAFLVQFWGRHFNELHTIPGMLARYTPLGNCLVESVMAWIGRRIAIQDAA